MRRGDAPRSSPNSGPPRTGMVRLAARTRRGPNVRERWRNHRKFRMELAAVVARSNVQHLQRVPQRALAGINPTKARCMCDPFLDRESGRSPPRRDTRPAWSSRRPLCGSLAGPSPPYLVGLTDREDRWCAKRIDLANDGVISACRIRALRT